MNITGELCTIGELSESPACAGVPGIQIRLACGRVVTLTGLSRDECVAAAPVFLQPVRLIVEAA